MTIRENLVNLLNLDGSDDRPILDFESEWCIDFMFSVDAETVAQHFAEILDQRYADPQLKVKVTGRKIGLEYREKHQSRVTRNNYRECFKTLAMLNQLLAQKYEIRGLSYRKDETRFRSFVIASNDEWEIINGSKAETDLFFKVDAENDFELAKMPQWQAKTLIWLGQRIMPIVVGFVVRRILGGAR